ncbi:hypothetical protein EII17_08870 [Clostridiales bacterium COT073_COT-073]|nr:hypothetical protein EII17_08870 [Clostridiales bacterium COT073_COT-073]
MESKFQFRNPRLSSLEYFIREDFQFDDNSEELSLPIEMTVGVKEFNKEDNCTNVFLQIVLGNHDKALFYLKAKEEAEFTWSEDLEKEKIAKLLKQNAPALLLSLLRPIIKEITSDLPYGSYYIPFMDFTK